MIGSVVLGVEGAEFSVVRRTDFWSFKKVQILGVIRILYGFFKMSLKSSKLYQVLHFLPVVQFLVLQGDQKVLKTKILKFY